ncbi:WD40 repeat domain-containing protein [Streptomyces sp. NPDC006365]|uniref:WD40 repeat domain-containing protein n=1 Tax=Streptomyces sp. NPDC006365 TaxID=3364744 RepID=UPI0036C76017
MVTVAFRPDGRTLATGDNDGTMRVWDTRTGRIRKNLPRGDAHLAAVSTPDGRTLAIVGPDAVELRDTSTGRTLKRLAKQTFGSGPMAFNRDGRTLAISSFGQKLELWDTATGRIRARLAEQTNDVSSLAFGPDGRALATGGFDGGAELWDAVAGRLRRSLPRHTAPVGALAFSPDGRTLATSSSDGGVKLWDAREGRLRKGGLAEHTALVVSMATGSADQTVRRWNVDRSTPTTAVSKICRTIGRNLAAQERSVYMPDQPPHAACPD